MKWIHNVIYYQIRLYLALMVYGSILYILIKFSDMQDVYQKLMIYTKIFLKFYDYLTNDPNCWIVDDLFMPY